MVLMCAIAKGVNPTNLCFKFVHLAYFKRKAATQKLLSFLFVVSYAVCLYMTKDLGIIS